MYTPLLKLLRETRELDEMALKPQDFPDTYLAKAKDRGAKARELEPIIKRFHEGLRNLRWQQIDWVQRGSSYYPILPDALLQIVQEAKALVSRQSDSFINGIVESNFGKWATQSDQSSDYIHMEVDSGQRSHFPGGGIPRSIRNVGLGYKLYRALLQKKTWLRSNTAGTLEKDNAWASLISPKVDEAGNLTEDDVHAILGQSEVMAMIKSLPDDRKIEIAKQFINGNISVRQITSTNFAMDDELKSIMPADFMQTIDPAERERVERERREQERREQQERARVYGEQRGIQWEEQPEVGDFVYVRQYAESRSTDIPLRIIAGIHNRAVYALSIPDYMRWEERGSRPEDMRAFDNRTCSENPEEVMGYFVKVDPSQIPGLEDGTAVFLDRYTRSDRQNINNFVMNRVDPELAAQRRTEREEAERTEREERERQETERRAQRAEDANRFGEPYENFEDAAYKRALETREPGGRFANSAIKGGRVTTVALSPAQMDRFNRRKSTEVFAPAGSIYYNTITDFRVDSPIDGLGFTEFDLERFSSKRQVTPNEMLYIATHSTYYGIIAPVDYVVLNRARNEEYIYLRVFDNTSGVARKIAIRVNSLRKLVIR